MFERIDDDWREVICELWSFPLAVLYNIIRKIQEGQFTRNLGYTERKRRKQYVLGLIGSLGRNNALNTCDLKEYAL